MSLPDLSAINAASPARLRAFAQTLAAIGLTNVAVQPIVDAVKHLDPALRGPARAFHLRKLRNPLGYAMRMFLFEDPVTTDEARAALGDLTSDLHALGLLEARDGGVVSPLVLGIADDLYLLSDALHRGDDAVMGLGETTIALARAAFPRGRVARALDLGCGAGTCALLLACAAASVVGTDLNPRAVTLARANAAINGVANVEFREGDRFDPVRGEAFDLIVAQPPYVPRPDGAARASALYGGPVGDELALSMLAAAPAHLTEGGRAVFIVEWPEHGDAPLEQRLRAAVGPGVDLLILRAPPTDLGAHAVAYASGFHPRLGAAFEADAIARLEHLERAGIRELTPTLVVLQRRGDAPGRTSVVSIEPLARVAITSPRIDAMLAARALASSDAALLAATLRAPEGTVLSQVQIGPGAEVPSTLSARFSPAAAVSPIDLSMELLFIVTAVHEAPTVAEGLARVAEAMEVAPEEMRASGLAAVKEALLYGLLEVGPA